MCLAGFDLSQQQLNSHIKSFGQHLKRDYQPYTSRELLDLEKIDFDSKLNEASQIFTKDGD